MCHHQTKLNLLIEDNMFSRHGIDLAAAFLHRLIKKNDVAETELLVNAGVA
jgi:16S rRNA G1207 methylase RsmC